MTKRLCVWNLAWDTTREDLYSLFGQVARVIAIDIPTRPNASDRSMGLGFVEIETGDLPGVIEKIHITDLNGRTLQVCESLPSRVAVHRVEGDVNVPVIRPRIRPKIGPAVGLRDSAGPDLL